jgi:[ribosomal protein S5]-alanine N-acetyltransferase
MKTGRLVLRPTRGSDADRAFEIQTDWEVTRMLRMASFPPDRQEIRRWFADHQREWLAGEAYRFAVELEGTMVGVVDVDGIAEREGTLGYWLDRAAWGRGYAFEAAYAVTRFAFVDVGLSKLKTGHAHDNPRDGYSPSWSLARSIPFSAFPAHEARRSCSVATCSPPCGLERSIASHPSRTFLQLAGWVLPKARYRGTIPQTRASREVPP